MYVMLVLSFLMRRRANILIQKERSLAILSARPRTASYTLW